MNVRLEEIQKRLDLYLETKRQSFPRFYFISNDDLLEILGQSKNPEAVQPHLKKLFDNMAKVKMGKVRDCTAIICAILIYFPAELAPQLTCHTCAPCYIW